MEDVWQLRWQLCTEGEGVYTASQISLIALRALTRLVDMHKFIDCRGVPYHPIPIAKKLLCGLAGGEAASDSTGMEQRESLFVIAQSMLCNDNTVVDTAATLLHKLILHNDEACAKLYLTGVFMFAVGYTGSNYHSIAKLLSDTHIKQNFRSGFAAAADATDLPLKERSILGNLLPEGLLYMLFNYGPERFTEVFVGDFDSPEVIWNFKMRKHMVEMIKQHLGDFPKRLWQNTCRWVSEPRAKRSEAKRVTQLVLNLFHLNSYSVGGAASTSTVRFPGLPTKGWRRSFSATTTT